MSDWSEIFARLDRMHDPDHSVDIAIARKLGVTVMRQKDDDSGSIEDTNWRYTEKIGDALSLLEPGWEYSISTLYGIATVELPLNDTRINPIRINRPDGSVPLAICQAAMAARDAVGQSANKED